jgi:hypothetical protein
VTKQLKIENFKTDQDSAVEALLFWWRLGKKENFAEEYELYREQG